MNTEHNSRILLVEDDHYSAVATKAIIEHEFPNVVVDPVRSVDKAIEVLKNGTQHELIISDFHLDNVNADEFISMLRIDNIDLPVIILTAIEKNAERVLGKDSVNIFKKEFENQALLSKIDDFLTLIGIKNGNKTILSGIKKVMGTGHGNI